MDSAGNSSSCNEKVRPCVKKVLDKYENTETQQLYEELVKLTREKCEKLLKKINEKGIKGVVQGRTKKYDSLKEKLEKLEEDDNKNPEESEWLKKKLTVILLGILVGFQIFQFSLQNFILLGILIGVVSQICQLFLQPELESKPDNEPPNFRDCVSENDIYKHPEMGDLAGVRIGLYFPDDVPRVVKGIKNHFDTEWLFGTVTGGRDATKGRNVDIEKHLEGPWFDESGSHWEHSGYKSWQMVVKPLSEHLDALKEGLNSRGVDLNSLRVEIQVGTVVTQAWGEVNHNIIYKKPLNIRSTLTMKRMIDAINGLAITTDIMLRELERSLEDAEKEAEALRQQALEDASWPTSYWLNCPAEAAPPRSSL